MKVKVDTAILGNMAASGGTADSENKVEQMSDMGKNSVGHILKHFADATDDCDLTLFNVKGERIVIRRVSGLFEVEY